MIIVKQKLYPLNQIDLFGVFDTKEKAQEEVNKAIRALMIAHPKANKKQDSLGNHTVYFDYSQKECMHFTFDEVEKNKQLSRIYKGDYKTLYANGWESNGNRVQLNV